MGRLFLLAIVGLAACDTVTARHFVGPDGSPQWWNIECHGDTSVCWRQAGAQCPHGYEVVDRSQHDDVKAFATTNAYGQTIAHAKRVPNGSMVIRCKEGAGDAQREAAVVEDVTPARPVAADAGAELGVGRD